MSSAGGKEIQTIYSQTACQSWHSSYGWTHHQKKHLIYNRLIAGLIMSKNVFKLDPNCDKK